MEKVKVLFVCHGNICRSPMAEFVFKDLVERQGLANLFHIESRATSSEEIGNPIHYGTKRKLDEHGIKGYASKRAQRITRYDYENFDFILIMDALNQRNIIYNIGEDDKHKISRLLDYSKNPRDISDPWYTGNFDLTYSDIYEGCVSFLDYLKRNNKC